MRKDGGADGRPEARADGVRATSGWAVVAVPKPGRFRILVRRAVLPLCFLAVAGGVWVFFWQRDLKRNREIEELRHQEETDRLTTQRVTEYERSLAKWEAEDEAAWNDYDRLQAECAAIRGNLQDLEAGLPSVKEELTLATDRYSFAKDKLREVLEGHPLNQWEVAQQQAAVARWKKEIDEAESRFAKAQHLIHDAPDEIRRLPAQLEHKQAELARVTARLQEVRAAEPPAFGALSGPLNSPPNGLALRVSLDGQGVYAKTKGAVVVIEATGGLPPGKVSRGSGFVVQPGNLVVTNAHVVKGATLIKVRFLSGKVVRAIRPAFVNERRDVAVVAVPGFLRDLPCLSLAEDLPQVGSRVYAIGAPAGMEYTLTTGIVSQIRRDEGGGGPVWVQTDASVSQGSSGGPLMNEAGEVVGMVTQSLAAGNNLNLALAVSEIRRALRGVRPP